MQMAGNLNLSKVGRERGMRMKRKWLAVLIGVSLMMPHTVVAMESDGNVLLESVIKKVKQQVNVPDELTDFNYQILGDRYYLYWNGQQARQSISIQAEPDGDIIYYNNNEESEASTLAQIDYTAAERAARNFLRQAAPKYEGDLILEEQEVPTKDNVYHINYRLEQEGTKVFMEEAYVEVSKQSGKVTAFSGIPYETDRVYEKIKPKLDLNSAQTSYLDQIGLELVYQTYYDYETKQTESFLTYEVNNGSRKGISASTGKTVELYEKDEDYRPYGMMGSATADAAATESIEAAGLTPSEQKKVDESEGLLSSEELKAKWEAYLPALEDMLIISSQLYQRDEVYVRDISFGGSDDEEKWAELYANARTGELLSYSCSSDESEASRFEEWTEAQGALFLEKVTPEASQQVRLKEISTSEEEKQSQQYFSYQRLINGIPVSGEGINFTYDTVSGQIIHFDKNWSNAAFKKAEHILDPKEAVKKIGLELVYMQTSEKDYQLVYNHRNSYELLDAITGELLNLNGEKKAEEVQGIYLDIKGHSQEDIIIKLFNSGIYLNEKELHPDDVITQKEALALLVRSERWGQVNEEDIYEAAFDLGLIEKSEENPNQLMTKAEGIRYLIKITPFKKVANLSDIYAYPYKDEKVDDKYKGAVSIAYGLGWTEEAEYFKPAAGLTKAQFMDYLYKLLDNGDQN